MWSVLERRGEVVMCFYLGVGRLIGLSVIVYIVLVLFSFWILNSGFDFFVLFLIT